MRELLGPLFVPAAAAGGLQRPRSHLKVALLAALLILLRLLDLHGLRRRLVLLLLAARPHFLSFPALSAAAAPLLAKRGAIDWDVAAAAELCVRAGVRRCERNTGW